KVVLELADDAGEPKQGVSAANKFVGDGIRFVVGPMVISEWASGAKASDATRVAVNVLRVIVCLLGWGHSTRDEVPRRIFRIVQ
ncbi:hypothetical protein AB9F41_36035, partial [Rhizobium leguminosarum]|uniref:hypothetical protein n=1 Tax=Rhizobium leguminosarum TaxID=384 RepID=UPI003F9812CB